VDWLPRPGESIVGTVYLLHLSRPYKHAGHYVGFTTSLERRLSQHRRGSTSPLLRCAVAEGIELVLARTWENVTPGFETWLHNGSHKNLACPICSGPGAFRRANCIRSHDTGIGY
jgi:hypothetical protein